MSRLSVTLVKMRDDFVAALNKQSTVFNVVLNGTVIDGLANYYELVQRFNPVLHLVAPCSPQEFATRHILESLTLLEHLPSSAWFADVGTGAGLPAVPCLIARKDLQAVLIESKEKKANYLNYVIAELKLGEQASMINRQFDEVKAPLGVKFVACRALDKFTDKLPRLLKWSGKRTLLFFGGPTLGDALVSAGLKYEKRLMPLSDQRYLFIVRRTNA